MTELDFIVRIGIAILLGSVVGIERQLRQRMAGLRTNALVSAGASLFVSLSQMIPTGGDQSRIASYVVSGIGFLGASVIMKQGPTIRGLNTAATLWCSAAIGSLAGFGFYSHAVVGSIASLATNVLLMALAQRLNHRSSYMIEQDIRYQIKATCRQEDESQLRFIILQSVARGPLVLQSIRIEDQSTGQNEVAAGIESLARNDSLLENVVSQLSMERGLRAVA